MILAACQCQHIFCCCVEPSLLLSSSFFFWYLFWQSIQVHVILQFIVFAEGHLVETCKAVCWIVVDRYVAICLSLYLAICLQPSSRVANSHLQHLCSNPEFFWGCEILGSVTTQETICLQKTAAFQLESTDPIAVFSWSQHWTANLKAALLLAWLVTAELRHS